MKRSTDYLNYEDLNYIEDLISNLTDEVKLIVPEIPDYEKKVWTLFDFPYIQEIDRIETGVANLGEYYAKDTGWQEKKKWLETGDEIKPFYYSDYNRWLIDLEIISNLPDTFTMWNGVTYVEWEIESDLEWEEY